MLSNEARRSAREGTPPDRYRTCCGCCNVKFGTVALGLLEALLASCILLGMVQQLIWKSQHSDICYKNMFRDCLIFKFNHFNITLIFDYIIALMMVFILLSVLLMFCGILSDTACLMIPHLIVQGFFLLFSLGYFLLYAWSYFYGDLYTHNDSFHVQSLIERMWLATLLLLLAGFQTYLFTAVVRCSLYLNKLDTARRRRESAFERCSERVRIAKENGLWRTASWGGGFMQYKGQYDENKPIKEKKTKPNTHVQWGTNIVQEFKVDSRLRAIEERYELPPAKPGHPDDVENVSVNVAVKDEVTPPKKSSPPHKRTELMKKEEGISRSLSKTDRRATPVSPKREAGKHYEAVEIELTARPPGKKEKRQSPRREDVRRTESRTSSSSASPPKNATKREKEQIRQASGEEEVSISGHEGRRHSGQKDSPKRPPLRSHKSMEYPDIPNTGRRRSSLGGDIHNTPQPGNRSPPEQRYRVESPHHVLKKVSITSTSGPVFV